jgi:putative flippase GtrA
MSPLVSKVRAQAKRPGIKKLVKYSLVSVIAVAITLVLQAFCYGVLHISAPISALIASSIAAVPSYILNRSWVWKKGGKSHMKREVLPFWIMVFVGLAASMGASAGAEAFAQSASDSRGVQTVIVTGASFSAFAILWFLKFVIFNKILFVHHPEDLDPALDGRAGLPT